MKTRGFTLIEVLVALAIFAFAAVVLASSYLNILVSYDAVAKNAAVSEDLAFARQLVLTQPDRTILEKGGEFDSASSRHVRWSVEITSTNMPDLYSVAFTCEIDDPGHNEPNKTTETFTLLRPTWTVDATERDKLRGDVRERIQEIQQKNAQAQVTGHG